MLDVKIAGTALNSFGFVAYNTIEGLGLNTFGFVWPCNGIWAPTENSISTTWNYWTGDSPTLTSSWSYWTGDSPTLTTSWTNCAMGISLGPEYCME